MKVQKNSTISGLRELAGLTQLELAQQAGVSRDTVIQAELGRNVTLFTLKSIAVVLNVSAPDLLAVFSEGGSK